MMVVATIRNGTPEVLVSKVNVRARDLELRDEQLKKRFELPPHLRQYATNLNMLAQQDRLPPVFGRDQEIQQVLEVLCHRERANSVMRRHPYEPAAGPPVQCRPARRGREGQPERAEPVPPGV
jgi:hypothetical protein